LISIDVRIDVVHEEFVVDRYRSLVCIGHHRAATANGCDVKTHDA